MTLHQNYNLVELKDFFARLDLSRPFVSHQLHEEYIKHKSEIESIIKNPKAYALKTDEVNQNYLDDNHVKTCFNNFANIYDNVMHTYWPFGREEFMKWLDPQRGEEILEIGVGTGLNLENYPDYCQVTGIDTAEQMLRIATQRLQKLRKKNITLLIKDASNTDFPENSFDKCLSTYSLCDASNPLRVLGEVKRVCKPNGKIVIADPLKSEIEEVAVLQYLFWPIGRQMGHLWLKNYPAYSVVYNSWLDLFSMLRELRIKVDNVKVYDPFKIMHLVKCTNTK
jgi:phosphatidylethanolamine/phosphatidyl-N-methylethanolamine N-methyltransferase